MKNINAADIYRDMPTPTTLESTIPESEERAQYNNTVSVDNTRKVESGYIFGTLVMFAGLVLVLHFVK